MISNLIKGDIEHDANFDPINFKNQRKSIRTLPQTGKSIRVIDVARHAMPSGKRISKTGKIYWETRKNRTDVKGTNI